MLEALCLALDKPMDGDTFWTCSGLKVRLVAKSGPIDAPELASSPRCNHCDPRPGIAARDRLRIILRRPAQLSCAGKDKYGRSLATLTIGGRDVAGIMIAEGLGRPYKGGKREGWCQE